MRACSVPLALGAKNLLQAPQFLAAELRRLVKHCSGRRKLFWDPRNEWAFTFTSGSIRDWRLEYGLAVYAGERN